MNTELTTKQINEFLAAAVLTMDADTCAAWDSMSDFEKKTIAASAFFFKEGYNQAGRSKTINSIQWANIRGA